MVERARGMSMTGVIMVMVATFSLPVGAALATSLFHYGGAWGVSALRLGLASVMLLLLVRPTPWRWTGAAWRNVALFGISLAGMNGFFYAAIERIPLGVTVAIQFVGPLALAVILSTNRRDLIWIGAAGLGLILLGLESMTGSVGFDLVGILFAALAGVSWVLYILFSARVGRSLPGLQGLPVAALIAAIVLLPVGFSGVVELVFTPEIYWLMLTVAFISTVVPTSLELAALRRLPRHTFSILLSLEPVFAALIGWVLLDQSFGILRGLAMMLIIGATLGMTASAARLSTEVVDERRARELGG
ncbi:MAG: EamA family transporter [Yaniella sp.]|uniref:EamA family transporter n=2 Tax=Yaniella sp. TaxID=2773929 RepID=UPI0026489008|nr:EamA family transporter [Yaniella sp.]MDN5705336.1 EamA family transporter [Yaniella sp.]MDN5732593.1 EamA family transporter [Yaniella sp.]MDN5816383.1 EamA family transporter [Yaniella sp.]MDN5818295.1 EamA family transporter [Yaniella sp.]MDN5839173.1 EamA family transporter [Yaniella sp.]